MHYDFCSILKWFQGKFVSENREDAPPAQPKRSASVWRDVGCSMGAALNALAGLATSGAAHGWRNEMVAGNLQVIGALALIPHILQSIRARFPGTRPRWIPVVYALVLMPVTSLIGQPFAPSPAEKIPLRAAAAAKEAEVLFAKGQVSEAGVVLNRYAPDHDPVTDKLLARIAAMQAVSAATPVSSGSAVPELKGPLESPGSAYSDRVQDYWLPAVKALPDTVPEDDDAYTQVISNLDELLQDVVDGAQTQLTPGEKAVRRQLIVALAKKQRTLFPSMRRRFGNMLRAKLFRDNIEVNVSGPEATTLTQVGPMFIDNANIEDNQKASLAMMSRARFRRETYRWGHYLGRTYIYTYHPPSDDAVMVWDIGTNQWKPIG